jgi:hypothetical protein
VGVDTFLAVFANGIAYENDDVSSGDRSSLVEFQAITDGEASASVTNKGLFGVDMGYVLELQEVGGDSYEPDDYAPRPISIWETQRHTFYPEADIDRVEFGVKGGRVYEFRTYSLTVGVDTVVSIMLNGVVYQSDDIAPGNQASRIVFTARSDGTARATITNRERYGVSNEYWVTLVELAGTPTPDLTHVAATPTPDCSDAYEPDDLIPRLVAVGDAQEHTFCALGDVDRVVFTAKAGYSYQIETFDLSLGVDTYLSAQIGSITLTNDDYAPPNLGSMIHISNTTGTDAPTFVMVMNKGLFGKDLDRTPRGNKLKVVGMDLSQGDAYEPDDVQCAPISIGHVQERTFDPSGDVDKVCFVAKAGHRYAIHTDNLGVLVDTVLTVDMGPVHLANDDRIPGDLSSYVELQNDGSDSQAMVTIANNGQYGPARTYTLQVDDLGTESADEYEPDLTVKRYISVGEAQRRTFHPYLDADRVVLQIKAGRRYAVFTCGGDTIPVVPVTYTTPFDPEYLECDLLPVGVDTVVVLSGPIHQCEPASCQSDDVLAGSDYLNSRVEFEALTDGEVTIMIYSNGLFGPTMEYYIRVHEIGALPPTPVAASPTPYYSPTPTLTATPIPPVTPTVTPPYVPPLTRTATPTPTETPVPTPTPTHTPGSYPSSFDLRGSLRHVAYVGVPCQLAEWQSKPLLARQSQAQASGGVIEFVLLLRMKPVSHEH